MIIKDAINWATKELIEYDSARLDADLLLAHILNKPAEYILAHDEEKLSFWQKWRYERMIAKRKKGIPVAYLTGHKEFYGYDLMVNKHTLVPRPDTELLVESVINYISMTNDQCPDDQLLLLDVGTGCGCIPIAILNQFKELTAIATDISSSALRVAKYNAKRYGLLDRLELIKSNLTDKVPLEKLKKFEVIVTANLPYIPTDYTVHESTKYEPNVALYGGKDGLDVYRKLTGQLMEIKPKVIFFELFEFQIATIAKSLPDYELKYTKNMSGEARCLMMERKDTGNRTQDTA